MESKEKKKNQRAKRSLLPAVCALALSGTLLAGAVLSHSTLRAEAKRETFSEIKKLVDVHDSESDAFRILEIVPDAKGKIKRGDSADSDSATVSIKDIEVPLGNIGYLISGQEPYNQIDSGTKNYRTVSYEYLLAVQGQGSLASGDKVHPLKKTDDKLLIYGMDEVPPSAKVATNYDSAGLKSYSDINMEEAAKDGTSGAYSGYYDVDQLDLFRGLAGSGNSSGAFTISSPGSSDDTPGLVSASSADDASKQQYGTYDVVFKKHAGSPYGVDSFAEYTVGAEIDEKDAGLGKAVYAKNEEGDYVYLGTLKRIDGKAAVKLPGGGTAQGGSTGEGTDNTNAGTGSDTASGTETNPNTDTETKPNADTNTNANTDGNGSSAGSDASGDGNASGSNGSSGDTGTTGDNAGSGDNNASGDNSNAGDNASSDEGNAGSDESGTDGSDNSQSGNILSASAMIRRTMYFAQGEDQSAKEKNETFEPAETSESSEQAAGASGEASDQGNEDGETGQEQGSTEGGENTAGNENTEGNGNSETSSEASEDGGDNAASEKPSGDGETLTDPAPESGTKVYLVSFKLEASGGYSITEFECKNNADGDYDNADGDYAVNVSSPWVTDSGMGIIKRNSEKSPSYIPNSEGKGRYKPVYAKGSSVSVYDAVVYQIPVFKNNDLFKQYVFDINTDDADKLEEELNKLHIKVDTVSADALKKNSSDEIVYELDGNTRKLNDVDLIYISVDGAACLGDFVSHPSYKDKDIGYDAARRILEMAAERTKPVMIESSLLGSDYDGKMIRKLADALRSRSLSDALNGFDNSTNLLSLPKYSDGDDQYVFQKLFFTKHGGSTLASSSFYKKSTDSEYEGRNGFVTVLKHIQDVRAQESWDDDEFPDYINMATSIRHILIFADTSSKGVYRILEIEPQDQSADRIKRWDNKKWGDGEVLHYDLAAVSEASLTSSGTKTWSLQYTDHSKDTADKYNTNAITLFQTEVENNVEGIQITHMSVHEFIGRIEDLNSTYDMIYIGADTIGMKTDSNGKTIYSDSGLDGLIYSDVGDKHGLIDKNGFGSMTFAGGVTRFSGNDILKADIDRLKEYAKAGLPVIIADEILNSQKTGVDSARVRNSSNLYKALQAMLADSSTYPAVYARSDVAGGNTGIYEKMEAARPMVSLVGNYKDDIVPTVLTETGQYAMSVSFHISDLWAGDDDHYTAEFYIDRNSDGKYSAGERDATAVSFEHGGETLGPQPTGLKAGTDYLLKRTFTKEQKGVVPWKLVIYQTGSDAEKLRRSSVVAYASNVVQEADKPEIKVLQLMTDGDKSSLNMQDQMEKAKKNSSDAGTIGKYLIKQELPFTMDVDSMTCDTFYNKISDSSKRTAEGYKTLMEQYNLVIMGFADSYKINKDVIAQALQLYIKDGRSTLFSHDCTSSYYGSGDGASFNLYVRDIVGLDRYGYNKSRGDSKFTGFSDDSYDPAPNGETDNIEGMTYFNIQRREGGIKGDQFNRLLNVSNNTLNQTSALTELKATKVNDGQITKYPYVLQDEISIVCTHGQYYQLNLNIDQDNDGMGDLVVWYCLGDTQKSKNDNELVTKAYAYSRNDVMNNYLIYSMGNVTYTGQGHQGGDTNLSSTNLSDAEAMLFVNTIVAAWTAGVQNPNVTIHSGPEITSGRKYAEVLPYDAAFMDELVDAAANPTKYRDPDKPEIPSMSETISNGMTEANAGDDSHLGAYPDYAGTTLSDANTYTVYFRPEELNVNVDTGTQKTEVAFFMEDVNGESLIKAPDGEKAVEDDAFKMGADEVKLVPITGAKVYRITKSTESGKAVYAKTEIDGAITTTKARLKSGDTTTEKTYPSYGLGGYTSNTVTSYPLADTSGNVMYAVEFPKSQVFNLSQSGGTMANDPTLILVLHTTLDKFKVPYNRYAGAELTYSRALLFNLE